MEFQAARVNEKAGLKVTLFTFSHEVYNINIFVLPIVQTLHACAECNCKEPLISWDPI